MLKKISIAAGVLFAVLAIAAVALVLLVDVNRFKPDLERFVQERYQRTLRIDGDLGLSLFPSIALSLPRSSLSERGGTGEAASLAGARVSVAVMPLLRGDLVADKVTVEGLKAIVERRADGSLSIDDLFGANEPTAAPAPPGTPAEPGRQMPRLDLGGLRLSGGQVIYRDQQAVSTVTISDLDLDTGRIANQGATPVGLKLAFATTSPPASGSLDLKAVAQIDLDRNVYGANDLEATLKAAGEGSRLDSARIRLAAFRIDPGRMALDLNGLSLDARGRQGEETFEAKGTAPRLALTEASATGDPLQAEVKLSGSRTLEARLEGSGLGGSNRALTLDRLTVDATLKQGARTLQTKLATAVRANLPAGQVELPGIAGTVVIEDPALPQKTTTIELAGSASVDSGKEAVQARVDAKAPGSTLLAKVDVSGFARPKVVFEATADQLDVDRYFPPGSPAGQAGPAGTPSASPAAPASAPAAAAGDPPFDLSALNDLDLAGSLGVGRLKARGLELSDLKVVLKALDGRLDVAPVSAALYGGRLAATAVARAGATPPANRFDVNADLTGISIGPLLRDLAHKDLLEGQGNVKLVLSAGGGTVDALKRGLDGRAALSLRNGAIKGINLGETIRSARNLLQVGSKTETRASDVSKQTDFTELGVSFVIADGVASSSDLDVKSPLLRLGGEGRADLVAGNLDYTVRASVVGTGTGQGGKELADVRGVTIPVRLTGPFDRLDWQIDWETAGKEALKSRASAELRERLKTDDIEGKAREKLGDALKGLFRR